MLSEIDWAVIQRSRMYEKSQKLSTQLVNEFFENRPIISLNSKKKQRLRKVASGFCCRVQNNVTLFAIA